MRVRTGVATAAAVTVAAGAFASVLPSASSTPPARDSAAARETCSTRSEADFPGAFTDPQNLVVGPLVLVGGTYTDATTVREFGGNKFPLLVKAGRTVTVRIGRAARRFAGLAYGPLPEGEVKLRDTHPSVTFTACRPGRSGSSADGVDVTFWSGFVLTRRPACVPLVVRIDERSPRRAGLALGRRCGGA